MCRCAIRSCASELIARRLAASVCSGKKSEAARQRRVRRTCARIPE